MYYGFGMLCVYLLLGGVIGYFVDADQMKRHVPYAELSSLLPLKVYRVICVLVGMAVGVPMALYYGPQRIVEEVILEIRIWRYRRAFRLLMKSGLLQGLGVKPDATFTIEKTKGETNDDSGPISTGGSTD